MFHPTLKWTVRSLWMNYLEFCGMAPKAEKENATWSRENIHVTITLFKFYIKLFKFCRRKNVVTEFYIYTRNNYIDLNQHTQFKDGSRLFHNIPLEIFFYKILNRDLFMLLIFTQYKSRKTKIIKDCCAFHQNMILKG